MSSREYAHLTSDRVSTTTPSKQHELEHYDDRSPWPGRIKVVVGLIVFLAILGFIAFIVFNVAVG